MSSIFEIENTSYKNSYENMGDSVLSYGSIG